MKSMFQCTFCSRLLPCLKCHSYIGVDVVLQISTASASRETLPGGGDIPVPSHLRHAYDDQPHGGGTH